MSSSSKKKRGAVYPLTRNFYVARTCESVIRERKKTRGRVFELFKKTRRTDLARY